MSQRALEGLTRAVVRCRRCPRLVAWRERVAATKRAAYAKETYWGRPLAGFGDLRARLLVVGLAPAAHGANRTGRMFTGDRSGEWLYRALYRAGFSNQPQALHHADGLRLRRAYVTAVVRCVPPANRPTPSERDRCLPYLVQELTLLRAARVIVGLGAFAWDGVLRALTALDWKQTPKPRFGHGVEICLGPYRLLGSYHPSQQNTFTGRLTEPMFDAIFTRARELLTLDPDNGQDDKDS